MPYEIDPMIHRRLYLQTDGSKTSDLEAWVDRELEIGELEKGSKIVFKGSAIKHITTGPNGVKRMWEIKGLLEMGRRKEEEELAAIKAAQEAARKAADEKKKAADDKKKAINERRKEQRALQRVKDRERRAAKKAEDVAAKKAEQEELALMVEEFKKAPVPVEDSGVTDDELDAELFGEDPVVEEEEENEGLGAAMEAAFMAEEEEEGSASEEQIPDEESKESEAE